MAKKPFKLTSELLFLAPSFMKKINKYSIRFHDAEKRGPHFDYALGNRDENYCVDFILPKKLTPEQLKNHVPNLPGIKKGQLVRFMEPHDVSEGYLTARLGTVHVIKEGYGAGTWFIVQKGKAAVQPYGKSAFLIYLDRTAYRLNQIEIEGNKKWLLRLHENEKKELTEDIFADYKPHGLVTSKYPQKFMD